MDQELATFIDSLRDVGWVQIFLAVTAAMGLRSMLRPYVRKLARESMTPEERAAEELERWLDSKT